MLSTSRSIHLRAVRWSFWALVFLPAIALADPPDRDRSTGGRGDDGRERAREGREDRGNERDRRDDKDKNRDDRRDSPHDGMRERGWRDGGWEGGSQGSRWGADGGPKGGLYLGRGHRQSRDAERAWLARHGRIPLDKLKPEETHHAQRVAKLTRIRELAVAAKDDAAVQRVDALLAKEQTRHEHWAQKHAQGGAGPAAGATGGAVDLGGAHGASGTGTAGGAK